MKNTLTRKQEQNYLIEFYNSFRSALLNKKYCQYRLDFIKKELFVIEIFVAITSSSTIAGIISKLGKNKILDNEYLFFLWFLIGILSAITSIVKPFLKLNEKMSDLTKRCIAFSDLYVDMCVVKSKISVGNIVPNKIEELYTNFNTKFLNAEKKIIEPVNIKLQDRCTKEVEIEIPVDSLWLPPNSASN